MKKYPSLLTRPPFMLFLQSGLAEEALHSVCVRALGIQQGARAKSAGEVIPGVQDSANFTTINLACSMYVQHCKVSPTCTAYN